MCPCACLLASPCLRALGFMSCIPLMCMCVSASPFLYVLIESLRVQGCSHLSESVGASVLDFVVVENNFVVLVQVSAVAARVRSSVRTLRTSS